MGTHPEGRKKKGAVQAALPRLGHVGADRRGKGLLFFGGKEEPAARNITGNRGEEKRKKGCSHVLVRGKKNRLTELLVERK